MLRYIWCLIFHRDWLDIYDYDYPELPDWRCGVCGREYFDE